VLEPANIRILLTADQIATRVRELGAQVSREYAASQSTPHLVCVLKGGCVFLSDLMRSIDLPVSVDFIAVSSYGGRLSTSGEVRIVKDLDQSLEGRDVLFVEDIIDTGFTLSYLVDNFRRRGARSVRIAALIDKKARRRVSVPLDFVGFEIADEFVVGYGLDHAEMYRNLPYVAVLAEHST